MSAPGKFAPIQGLHHWAYRCRDAEETRRFYEDLLGLPLTHFIRGENYVGSSGEKVEVFVHLFFEMADGSSLAFFDLGDDGVSEPSPNTPRWCNHLALQVKSVEDLDRAHRRLVEAGVEVVGPLLHEGYVKSIYFFDPNGARLELTTQTASPEMLAEYRRAARPALEAWTAEKRRRRQEGASPSGRQAVPVAANR